MMESSNNESNNLPEIYSKTIRAGRRTYFFDVRETKAGDYYLTITESKKNFGDDGVPSYRKHKIYLYKEDFNNFKESLDEVTNYIFNQKGEEVISEKHQPDYEHRNLNNNEDMDSEGETEAPSTSSDNVSDFTDVDFNDI